MKRKNKKVGQVHYRAVIGTLGVCLQGNKLAGNNKIRAGDKIIQAGEGTIRTEQIF